MRGTLPDFLTETAEIRAGDWMAAPIPPDLQDRRVEITGPTDRKMVINALNSGAKVFMADCEDANAPTWSNMVEGQLNLSDAVRRKIEFKSPEGKEYRLADKPAVLFVRPRGWHLLEKHVLVDGEPVSGGLFDCLLYLFHNAKELSSGVPVLISISRKWRVIWKHDYGTTCSSSLRTKLESRAVRFGPRF